MGARKLPALVLCAVSTWLLTAGVAFGQGQAAPNKPGLRVWAYVGPAAVLAGARVEVRDARGRTVASGKTGSRGTLLLRSFRQAPRLPLSVRTSGGRAAGKAFTGRMQARVFSTRIGSPITQLSLVSTAASRLARDRKGYQRMTSRVRGTLGIGKGSLPDVLRLRNDDVGYAQLIRAFGRTRGGFDAYARRVAGLARRGKAIGGLRPRSAASSGALPRVRARAAQSAPAPDTTVCSASLPSQDPSTDTSTEVISDIAEIGVGSLLEYAGAPISASDGLAGMLFAPIGENPETTILQEDVTAVADDLNCIDEQINYLSSQIAVLQLTVDVDTATDCSNAVTPGWQNYEFAINDAASNPLNSSNTSLTQVYLPSWNAVNTTCGSAINAMLFGTAGGQQSAWQQLNKNTTAGVQWYTQAQSQSLQTFLSYWGTILYQQFILSNEYYNFYGYFEAAAGAAGGSNPTGTSPVCDQGSNSQTATFCVWQNNIAAAYPGDLYSDEIGVISSGQSIAAVPGGMVAPAQPASSSPNLIWAQPLSSLPQYSPTAMNLQWWYDYFLNFVTVKGCQGADCPGYSSELQFQMDGGPIVCVQDAGMGCPSSSTTSTNWAQTAVGWFNGLGVNPGGYGSAVETFQNPQSTSRTTVTSSDVSALTSVGPDSQSSESFFYNAINQTPDGGTPAWGSLSDSQPTYMAADTTAGTSSVNVQMTATWADFYINFKIDAPLGNTASVNANWYDNNIPPNTPTAFLTGRTWWPGAAQATTYQPPQPPT